MIEQYARSWSIGMRIIGFDYYGYLSVWDRFRFKMGVYDPITCTGWLLRPRKESDLESIAALHEFYGHPKFLHDFDNLIHETLVQAFLDGGENLYQKWLESYRPLVEGTILAKIYVNTPNLYKIAYEASDPEARDVAEKLICIYASLLELQKHSTKYPLVRIPTGAQPLKPQKGVSTSIMEELASYAMCLSYSSRASGVAYGDPKFHNYTQPRYSGWLDFLILYLGRMEIGKVLPGEKPLEFINPRIYRFWFALEMANLIQNEDRNIKVATMSILANLTDNSRDVMVYLVKEDKSKFPITRQKRLFHGTYYTYTLRRHLKESPSEPFKNPTSYTDLFSFIKENLLWKLSQLAPKYLKDEIALYEGTIKTLTRLLSQVSNMYKLWKKGKITNSKVVSFYKTNFGHIEHLSRDTKSFWYHCCQKAEDFLETFNPENFGNALRKAFNYARTENMYSMVVEDFAHTWTEIAGLPLDVKEKAIDQLAFDIDGLTLAFREEAGISMDPDQIRRECKTGNVYLLP